MLSFIVVLPITNVLYTIVMLFIVEKSMSFLLKDLILKAVTVISKYNKEISADIYEMTGRGATLSGKGAYQKVIQSSLCRGIPKSSWSNKKIVNANDENAF